MKLSEAIRIGRAFRPESHQGDPFVRVANADDLFSDVWGAATEAVHSLVAKRPWTEATRGADIEYFREVQRKYFGKYFQMPAICPGARPRTCVEEGRRIVNRRGECKTEGERALDIGPITSECRGVVHLAGFVEHVFYAHNWSSEQVAQAVEWYESQQPILIAQTFEHYQSESLRQTIGQREVLAARQREIARHQRASNYRHYVN
jgi:hypothetical protein